MITQAHRLPCKIVVHTALPRFDPSFRAACGAALAESLASSLRLFTSHTSPPLSSIAVPVLHSDEQQWPESGLVEARSRSFAAGSRRSHCRPRRSSSAASGPGSAKSSRRICPRTSRAQLTRLPAATRCRLRQRGPHPSRPSRPLAQAATRHVRQARLPRSCSRTLSRPSAAARMTGAATASH